MTELIVGYDCRVYVHVDAERGEVVRVAVEPDTLADPTLVEGPAELGPVALDVADRAAWPAWRVGT